MFEKAAVELQIPRDISSYCMLGVKFTPQPKKAEIIIYTSNYDEDIYLDNSGMSYDIIHKGIPKEYVSGITEALNEYSKYGLLNQGRYEFITGAHAEVGSSIKIFYMTTNILLKIMQEKNINKDSIWQIIQNELKK